MAVLAVPVARTEAALRVVRPALTADHLVVEVGSVKTGPVAALTEVLGSDVPWAATHPLFGPVSLALGERPLRTFVCPNADHPEASRRAGDFWRGFGCEIREIGAEEHDALMARTHALAFFLAKGVMEVGFDESLEWVPPSVRGIARTVRSARADAGQLLASLHRENPYAAPLRARLLESLTELDAHLRRPAPVEEEPHHEPEALRLSAPAAADPMLAEVRRRIDELDHELLRLIALRTELALEAGREKASVGRTVRDPAREAELLSRCTREAVELGLHPEAVADVFRSILGLSRRHQEEERRSRGESP